MRLIARPKSGLPAALDGYGAPAQAVSDRRGKTSDIDATVRCAQAFVAGVLSKEFFE